MTKLKLAKELAEIKLFSLDLRNPAFSEEGEHSKVAIEVFRMTQTIIRQLNAEEEDEISRGMADLSEAIDSHPTVLEDKALICSVVDVVSEGRPFTDIDLVKLVWKIGTPAFNELSDRLKVFNIEQSWMSFSTVIKFLGKCCLYPGSEDERNAAAEGIKNVLTQFRKVRNTVTSSSEPEMKWVVRTIDEWIDELS